MANDNLKQAKRNKKDEFYTQLCDIENELCGYFFQMMQKIMKKL